MTQIKNISSALFASGCIALLSACGGSSGGDDDVDVDRLYVAQNGSGNSTQILALDSDFGSVGTFTSGGNEGIAFDDSGTLYQASDSEAIGKIRVIDDFEERFVTIEGADSSVRIIGGMGTSATGLGAPKGIDVIDNRFIVVADFGAGNVKTFNTSDSGDVAPVAVTPLSDAKPWDVVYDASSDRLYVTVTNGTVDVFDNFIGGNFAAGGPNRTIVPSNSDGEQISTNLHGIAYEAGSDRLYVTDVGDANASQGDNFATDGALYVISNASTASEATSVDTRIAGPSTLLGNPVDLILVDGNVLVAEKTNDAVLGFDNVLSASGDVTPSTVVSVVKPESLLEGR